MPEAENSDVVQEVVQPSTPDAERRDPPKSVEPEKGSAEYNFRETRKVMAEQSRKIQEMQAYIDSQKQAVDDSRDDDDALAGIGNDDFLTRKQAEALATRKAKELMQQQEVATLEDRTRLKFRDYDDVVTDENIQALIEDDEVMKNTLRSSPDPYAAAYKMIKKSAFYSAPKKPSPEVEKIAKNAAKPVSSNAVAARPLTGANEFTRASKEEQNALYREMMEYGGRR